jgi:glycosyltransferase involved in cell wall biosynthesis
MAAGKPIVATNIEWHAEVITHMKNGIIVEHLNIEELANAVILLLTDSTLSNNLGKQAREFAVNNLDWDAIANQYFDIFSNLENADYISDKYLKRG